MEPIIGIDKEGERPTKSRSGATATTPSTSGSGAILQSRVGFASEKRVECTYVLDTSGERSKARSCEARLLCEGKKMEPIIGIEPMTCSLRVSCSTD